MGELHEFLPSLTGADWRLNRNFGDGRGGIGTEKDVILPSITGR
jgi:hypothetical protein